MAWTCIGEPMALDRHMWDLYCRGYPESEAANILATSTSPYSGMVPGGSGISTFQLVMRDVVDQYRSLAYLETAMSDPRALLDGAFPLVTLGDDEILEAVENYYTYDPTVVRALLGKHLTSKLRKDLDEIAAPNHLHVKECWRIFDNLRRIFNYLDDLEFTTPLFSTIRQRFCLSPGLAWKYSCLIFLLKNRFNLAENKRRLAHIPCDVFINIASAMLCVWCEGQQSHIPGVAPWRHLTEVLAMHALASATGGEFSSHLPVIVENPASETLRSGQGEEEDATQPLKRAESSDASHGHAATTGPFAAFPSHMPLARGGSLPDELLHRNSLPVPPEAVSRSSTSFSQAAASDVSGMSGLSSGFPTATTSMRQTSTATVGSDVGSTGSICGISIDTILLSTIRDMAQKISRSRVERAEHSSTVLAHFAHCVRMGRQSNTLVALHLAAADEGKDTEPTGQELRSEQDLIRKIEPTLSSLLKSIREIAVGLSSVSEFRDLFEDVQTKVVDTLQASRLGKKDAALMCTVIGSITPTLACLAAASTHHKEQYALQWRKFMLVVEVMVVNLYDM